MLLKFIKKINRYISNKLYLIRFNYLLSKYGEKHVLNWNEVKKLIGKTTNEKICIKFKDGFKIECRISDLSGVAESCILNDYYKYASVKDGDIVFDVGSCVGDFAISAAFKGAKVFAFEPDPINYEILVNNIKINNLEDKITAIQMGIYDTSGEVCFNNQFENTAGYNVTKDGNVRIKTITLKEVMDTNSINCIDILKIDVEGSEYKIFSNPITANLENIKIIVGEYHLLSGPENSGFKLIKELLKFNFKNTKSYLPYYFIATN